MSWWHVQCLQHITICAPSFTYTATRQGVLPFIKHSMPVCPAKQSRYTRTPISTNEHRSNWLSQPHHSSPHIRPISSCVASARRLSRSCRPRLYPSKRLVGCACALQLASCKRRSEDVNDVSSRRHPVRFFCWRLNTDNVVLYNRLRFCIQRLLLDGTCRLDYGITISVAK